MNKLYFEAFDILLRDIMKYIDDAKHQNSFGGRVIVSWGDFRQIFFVVKKISRYDVVKSSINYFDLQKHCK